MKFYYILIFGLIVQADKQVQVYFIINNRTHNILFNRYHKQIYILVLITMLMMICLHPFIKILLLHTK